MLVYRKRQTETEADIDSIHNYYETLVLDRILKVTENQADKSELIADIACVALNRLPPRYIRYDVDMAFYLSPNEYAEIENKVIAAVDEAVKFVSARGRRDE